MDKYEFKLKVDEMKALVSVRNYNAAAEIAETINWRKIRNLNALVLAGEIFEQVGQYDHSKEILLMAYDKSPIGRNIIYRLAEIAIKTKNFDDAREYYDEFVDIAPHDNLKYVLKYKMTAAQEMPYEDQIKILEELKEQEYSEEWAYELALLYHKAGQTEKCVDACDELILWFGDGIYVEKALELKLRYQPLTRTQEEKYRLFRQKRAGIIEVKPRIQVQPEEPLEPQKPDPAESVRSGSQNQKNQDEEATSQLIDFPKELPHFSLPKHKKRIKHPYIPVKEEGIPIAESRKSIGELMSQWEKTEKTVQEAIQSADAGRLLSAKEEMLKQAEFLMERLLDVIPQVSDGSEDTGDIRFSEQDGGEIANDIEQAGRIVASMNMLLQEQIDSLLAENQTVRPEFGHDTVGQSQETIGMGTEQKIQKGVQGMDPGQKMQEQPAAMETGIQRVKQAMLAGARKTKQENTNRIDRIDRTDRTDNSQEILQEAKVSAAYRKQEADISAPLREQEAETFEREQQTGTQDTVIQQDKQKTEEPSVMATGIERVRQAMLGARGMQQKEQKTENPDMHQRSSMEYQKSVAAGRIQNEMGQTVHEKSMDNQKVMPEMQETEFQPDPADEKQQALYGRNPADGVQETVYRKEEASVQQAAGFQSELTGVQQAAYRQEPVDAVQEVMYQKKTTSVQQETGFQPSPAAQQETGFQSSLAVQKEGNYEQEPAAVRQEVTYGQEPAAVRQEVNYEQEPAMARQEVTYGQEPAAVRQEVTYGQEPAAAHQEVNYEQEPVVRQEANYEQDLAAVRQEVNYGQEPAAVRQEVNYGQKPAAAHQEVTYGQEPAAVRQQANYRQNQAAVRQDANYGQDPAYWRNRESLSQETGSRPDIRMPSETAAQGQNAGYVLQAADPQTGQWQQDYGTGREMNLGSGGGRKNEESEIGLERYGEQQKDLGQRQERNKKQQQETEMKVKQLTPERREVFSYFVPISGMEAQIYDLLEGVAHHLQFEKDSVSGNFIVEGIKGSGKTVLITDIIKVLQKELKRPNGKIGRIDANALNQKDLHALTEKVSGGCLIIESAGKISRDTAVKLSQCMDLDRSGTLYILEDTKQGIQKALDRDSSFSSKFTEKISIPNFSIDELAEFGRAYANDLNYDIDDMGILALYKRINHIQKLDHVTTLTEVKEIVDEAIDNAEKGALKKVLGILTSTRYNDDNYVILREKDFE